MQVQDLQGKKIAMVGLGVNNRRLADFLTDKKISYEIIENWKDKDELIGKLDEFDIIFRSPGLPYTSKAIMQAKAKGVEISSQTKLFFDLCPALIIGVTGTKGKGTTSSLIREILAKGGKKVFLGGNIGTDPFEFIDQLTPSDLVVLELSSFQIQDLEKSPHVAVVLGITSDHLNHHQNLEEYVAAKTNIISHQTENDFAVLNPNLPESFQKLGAAQKITFNPIGVASWKRKLLGEHNLDNIAAAAVTGKILGIPENIIIEVIGKFEPLPHRLNILGEFGGITYIDDGYSTNIDPCVAAIQAMAGPFVLIVGGHDKGLDFTLVGDAIKSSTHLKGLVVIGQVANQILKAAEGFSGKILTGAKDMNEILSQARSLASSGDVILFSPGTSSFDMFQNETDRAEQFVRAVKTS